MKLSEIPCKPDCPRRSWDCHPKCPEYKEFVEKVKVENDMISKRKKEAALQRTEDMRRKGVHK